MQLDHKPLSVHKSSQGDTRTLPGTKMEKLTVAEKKKKRRTQTFSFNNLGRRQKGCVFCAVLIKHLLGAESQLLLDRFQVQLRTREAAYIQVQRSDMQLTVYSSLVTLTSSSCICTPMSLLWKREGKEKNKQRDNEINDKIRNGINAADVSASPQRWTGKVTLQVDTVNEDCGTSGSVLIKTQ